MKKTLKKALALVISFSIVFSGTVAIGLNALAATPEYIYTDGKRTGIKSILSDDGVRYYDIADGGMLDDSTKEIDFYLKALTAEYNGVSSANMWANIASNIFEEAGVGVGYSLKDRSFSDYDDFFTEDKENTVEDIDLVKALSTVGEYRSGSMSNMAHGGNVSTGLSYFPNLNAVQDKMVDQYKGAVSSTRTDLTKENLLTHATGNSTGFPLTETDDGKLVIASVVTNRQMEGFGSYSTFALAFYDFELIPFVAEGVEFVTAGEGYGSIEEASADNAPGVTYNSAQTSAPFVSYTTNPSRVSANTSVSYSETSSVSVSNSMESSKTHSYGHSAGVSVSLERTFKLIGTTVNASGSYSFSTQDTVSTAYGKTDTLSESTTKTSTAEIDLPAHTRIGISQKATETEIILSYNCPVYITYKVAVMGINGYGSEIADSFALGSIYTTFGTSHEFEGVTACDNLYQRAISNIDKPTFEESQVFSAKSSGLANIETPKGINWESIIDEIQNGCTKSVKDCVNWLNDNVPLSSAGAKLTMKQKGIETDLTGIEPLYNLSFVTADVTTAYSLAKGGSIDLLDVRTQGFNQHGVPYYGYLPLKGSWSVCDAHGNPVANETGITLEKPTYTQILTANEIGDYYVRFNIDEKTYTDVDDETKYITNEDLSAFPIVKICVTNTGENHNCVAGDWVTTIPATCFMEGAQVKNCLTCGIQMETRILEKTEHTHMVVSTSASCTEKGSVVTSCGVCGATISTEETEATGHDDGIWKVDFEATAEHDGQMSRYCTKCGDILETKAIKLHTHEKGYEKIITPATCTQYGEKGVFCKICDAMYESEQIAKSGHGDTVSVISIQPTCTNAGEEKLYCKDCGMLVGAKEISAKGHGDNGVWIKSVAPTCTEAGEEICICADCKAITDARVVDALGHDDGVWKIDFEATADRDGQMSRRCSKCDAVLETKKLTVHEHTFGYEEVIRPATCTVDGLKGKICSTCGICYETEVISAKGHGQTIDLITVQPTCTTDGEKVTYCIDCGMSIKAAVISSTGHDEGVWKIDFEATADHKGQMSKYCSKCGEILETKEFEKHEHTAGYTKTTAATCTADGEKETFCADCGVVYKTEVISAKGHGETFAVITVKATCTEAGEKTLYCSDCGKAVGTEEIKAYGHSGETYVVSTNPTCTHTGEKTLRCDTCGEIIGTEEIPATGHSTQWLIAEEATCTKYGREEKTCTVCGTVVETRRIEKEEHVPGKWEITQPSSCTQSGLMQQACALCSALIGEPVVIDPHEHQAGGWVTVREADCENDGEKVKNCTVCNGAIATESIPALGHTDGTWITGIEASCENKGEEHLVCTRCEHIIDKKEVAALGHTFTEWHSGSNGTHSRTCLNCSVVETNNCDYAKTVTASTCTEGGYTTYVCTVCSHTYVSDYTEATGHNWSEWTECADHCCHERECLTDGCDAKETQNHVWGEWIYNEDGKFFKNGTKTRVCDTCEAEEIEEAEHTSFFGKIFYPVIVFFGNIAHKIIWIFSLNWLFPELTITPKI